MGHLHAAPLSRFLIKKLKNDGSISRFHAVMDYKDSGKRVFASEGDITDNYGAEIGFDILFDYLWIAGLIEPFNYGLSEQRLIREYEDTGGEEWKDNDIERFDKIPYRLTICGVKLANKGRFPHPLEITS